jgi:hypothetical protein
VTGNDDATRQRPTRPGDTRFWCSCDPDRQHPFYNSTALVEHVMKARASDAGDGSTALGAGQHALAATGPTPTSVSGSARLSEAQVIGTKCSAWFVMYGLYTRLFWAFGSPDGKPIGARSASELLEGV